ncbi:hypothetical protein NQ176_g4685 [Zarea fungicola]|uniref:Uncharacterized protein n=1 Tax=Zarea fungicola TaxID=93591 RepID=A0ACC1NC82_9HYPO|nr:hypothetical protein NQ176_g4685 [Lecanicillium fungicola]
MKLAVFSTKPYDRQYLNAVHSKTDAKIDIIYHEVPLNEETVSLTEDAQAVCVFVNDSLGTTVVETLARHGVQAILPRCARGL